MQLLKQPDSSYTKECNFQVLSPARQALDKNYQGRLQKWYLLRENYYKVWSKKELQRYSD